MNRVLNQAVKRNIDRFPDDFMFQLTKEEWENLKSQIMISSEDEKFLRSQIVTIENQDMRGRHIKYLPYVFTEQGVAMLSSVLRSKVALQMNINIMRAFIAMRRTIAALATTETKLELLNEKVERLNMYIEEVLRDQNDINEQQRAINEETSMQLELINQSLAELQANPKEDPVRPVGFNSPIYNEN